MLGGGASGPAAQAQPVSGLFWWLVDGFVGACLSLCESFVWVVIVIFSFVTASGGGVGCGRGGGVATLPALGPAPL